MATNLSHRCLPILTLALAAIASATEPDADYQPIFDGRSLANWETPDTSYWTIEDGAITGRITKEHPCTVNQYLVYTGGELADFDLKLKCQLTGEGAINGGLQFRSRLLPDHDVCGYQVDNNLQTPWLVRLYDEFGRHTLAMRGENTTLYPNGVRTTVPVKSAAGDAWFKLEDWHEYHLTCIGPKITLRVNGQLAAEVTDRDPRRQELQGILALQLHSGPPTVVRFKDIQLIILKPAARENPPPLSPTEKRRAALFSDALAYWPLDTGGHGAKPPLRSIPGWEQFELNVKADGPKATPRAKVATLNGAYFDAGPNLHAPADQLTVFLRARDPQGLWNYGLFAKRGGHDRVHFNLFSTDLPGFAGPDIGFEVRTDQGFVMTYFPVSRIDPSAWHDLVGRYDGQTLALFCDGRLMTLAPCHGKLVQNQEPLLIGAETDNNHVVRHFRGELEEAALWPRALTDEEISLLSH